MVPAKRDEPRGQASESPDERSGFQKKNFLNTYPQRLNPQLLQLMQPS